MEELSKILYSVNDFYRSLIDSKDFKTAESYLKHVYGVQSMLYDVKNGSYDPKI